jgi:hypothetical protein
MFPIFAGNSAATGYNLTRSLRLRTNGTSYLSRTFGTPTNNKIWTISAWVKRGATSTGVLQSLFIATAGGSAYWGLSFLGTDQLYIFDGYNATSVLQTNAVYRDSSAWYHIVVATDTTQATASNRTKLYVNGVQITSFSTATYPVQNLNTQWNLASQSGSIGRDDLNGRYFDGYLAEVNFIDGQALTPSSFGSTNTLTGVWQPARYVGTYGVNGFYQPYTDNSALTTSSNVGLGKDFSGNTNYWATNNVSITAGVNYDSMTDVPTLTSVGANNYAVLNPLNSYAGSLIYGNLIEYNAAATWNTGVGSIYVNSGKWYAEATVASLGTGSMIGIADLAFNGLAQYYLGITAQSYGYFSGGTKWNNAVGTSYGATFTTNDVIGIALDFTAGTLTFYKNNVSQGVAYSGLSGSFTFGVSSNGFTSTAINFGQQPFVYTPPTGHLALNAYNLPNSTIIKGNTVMDATLYTGTLLSNPITNAAAFKPDLVWVKSRSAATDNKLTDSVRGVTKGLISNSSAAETTDTQGLTAFNTNGFTVGTDTNYNNLAATYVGWQWQAGQGSSASNTNGSITSTVSVNASAGFSVVTFTGTGVAGATVGHGLGVAPAFMLVKARGTTGNWLVYHQSLGNAGGLVLELTSAFGTNVGYWNNTSPTSSVFTLGTFTPAATAVAYCWASIPGYSAFGLYTGNGLAAGPFQNLGFKPKALLIKSASGAEQWTIYDTARDTYNAVQYYLTPNGSFAEGSVNPTLNIVSNGFQINYAGSPWNTSSGLYIYAAFAENPFKNSLAR